MDIAFHAAPTGIAIVDRDGVCVRANAAMARLLDADPAELAGARLVLLDGAEPAPLLTGDAAAVEYDRELERPDLPSRWLLVAIAAADPEHLVVTAHDITERKAAEADLRARETTFRTIFEDSHVGIALVDADGRFIQVNRAHAAMHGCAPDELVGVHFSEVVPEEVRDEKVEIHEEYGADAGIEGVDFDVPWLRPDGTRGWTAVGYSIVRDADGNPLYNVVQVRDVTDRKLAEQALRESEERYRSLVEHLPLAIFRWPFERGGGKGYFSPQMQAMLGYPPEAWDEAGNLFVSVVHPDDRERVHEQRRRLGAGEDFALEYRMIASDGGVRTVRAHATALEQDGRRYVQGYVQDLTEQRQLEQQLRIAQKLEAIGQLAAGIAHEINTPIQFVGDSTAFIQSAFEDLLALLEAQEAALAPGAAADAGLRARVEQAREIADLEYLRERLPAAFERTADGIDRMAGIVRAVKQFAHPQTGDREPVDVNEALRNTLVVADSQYKLIADVETDLGDFPPVIADAGELNQVFINLIVNASHAIADVVGETGERGTIRITTRHEGEHVLIAIADSGCGIAEENIERIFDPFFTTKDVGQGTGQGLAITRAIVCDRHNGAIAVHSEPGRGSTFEVRLPVAVLQPVELDAARAA